MSRGSPELAPRSTDPVPEFGKRGLRLYRARGKWWARRPGHSREATPEEVTLWLGLVQATEQARESEDRARIGDHALVARRRAIEYLREWVRMRDRLHAMAVSVHGTAIESLLLSEIRRQDKLASDLLVELGVTGDGAEEPGAPMQHPRLDSDPPVAD